MVPGPVDGCGPRTNRCDAYGADTTLVSPLPPHVPRQLKEIHA